MDLRRIPLFFAVVTSLGLLLSSLPAPAQYAPATVIGPSTFAFSSATSHVWTCNSGQSSFQFNAPAGLVGTYTITVGQTSSGPFTNPPFAFAPGSSTYANTVTNSGSLTASLGSNLYVQVTTTYTSGSATVRGVCSTAVAAQPPATPIAYSTASPLPILNTSPGPTSSPGNAPLSVPVNASAVPYSLTNPLPVVTAPPAPTPIPWTTGSPQPSFVTNATSFPTPIPWATGSPQPSFITNASSFPTPIPWATGSPQPSFITNASSFPTPIPWSTASPEPITFSVSSPLPVTFLTANAPTSGGVAAITTATNTALITGTVAKSTYFYGIGFTNSGSVGVNVSLVTFTGTSCAGTSGATGTIWGPFYLAPTAGGIVYPIEIVAGSGLYVCVHTDAAGNVTGSYTEYQQ